MADAQHATAPEDAMDYAEHERTYLLFTSLVRNGATAVVILLVLLAFFLL